MVGLALPTPMTKSLDGSVRGILVVFSIVQVRSSQPLVKLVGKVCSGARMYVGETKGNRNARPWIVRKRCHCYRLAKPKSIAK